MKWFWRGLVATVVFVMAFAAALVCYLPAAVVVDQLQKQQPAMLRPLGLAGTRGTVWDGQTSLQIEGQRLQLSWELLFAGLLSAELPLALRATGDDLSLAARISMPLDQQLGVTGGGRLALSLLDPMLKRHRIEVPGEVEIQGLVLVMDPDTRWLKSAAGRLSWPGGRVSFPAGREIQESDVPELLGSLLMDGQDLVLNIVEAAGQEGLIGIRVGADMVARVEVRRRLLDVVGLPWSKQSAPDDVIFRVQQRLGRR